MRCLTILISFLLLANCSPTQRMARLIKRNPDLLVIDSVTIPDTVFVPSVKIDTFFLLDTSTAALDSVLKDIEAISSATIPIEIIERIRYLYKYKAVIKDTVSYIFPVHDSIHNITDTISIRVWQSLGKLNLQLVRKPRILIQEVRAPCPTLVWQPSLVQKFLIWSGGIFWIAIALGLLYRKLFK